LTKNTLKSPERRVTSLQGGFPTCKTAKNPARRRETLQDDQKLCKTAKTCAGRRFFPARLPNFLQGGENLRKTGSDKGFRPFRFLLADPLNQGFAK